MRSKPADGARRLALPVVLVGAIAAALAARAAESPSTYADDIRAWQTQRQERLVAPDGWTTLVGLFWLEPGDNAFGAAEDGPIVLPPGSAPARAGRFVYADGAVRVVAAPGVDLTVDGEAVRERVLASDASETGPDVVRLGRLSLTVLDRGGKHAIRVKDPESPVRRGFSGLRYYPIDPAFRVEGHLRRAAQPRHVHIPTVVGVDEEFVVPGTVEFTLAGQHLEIEPLVSSLDDEELFIIFKDTTNGQETYGAGRYLYAPLSGDKVTLDFNKAYNPPCAFTHYATCPLAPKSNRLPLAVTAGELAYGSGSAPSSAVSHE